MSKQATQSDSELHEQSEQVKSVPVVPSKRHKHDWIMIDSYDGRPKYKPLPEGQWVQRGGIFGGVNYIPGFDSQMLHERILDTIQQSEMPWFTSQTWACHCGKTKTNTQEHLGVSAMLAKRSKADDPVSDLQPSDSDAKTKGAKAQSSAQGKE